MSPPQALEHAAIARARAGEEAAFRELVEPHRRALRAHCYRMSGSLHEADDLVQECLVRAWKGLGAFEGRASVRTWLYRIATNTCLNALEHRRVRSLPSENAAARNPAGAFARGAGEPRFVEPCPDELADADPSPEARLDARQSVAFAFLVALQRLPPRQRAALLLRDVLGWSAAECADALEWSVAAVNSALQRAREAVGDRPAPPSGRGGAQGAEATPSAETRALLARYVEAWERADVEGLVALLRHDATLAMPPMEEWFEGAAAIGASIAGMVFTPEARGAFRLRETRANGLPALAVWCRDAHGRFTPSGVHVLSIEGDRIASITAFLDPSLFPRFGLPDEP